MNVECVRFERIVHTFGQFVGSVSTLEIAIRDEPGCV